MEKAYLCTVLQGTAFIAGWSSPVARQAHNLKVVGSNPAPATQDVKSYAQIAQLVEQRTENPRVAGSIPALGTKQRDQDES